MTAVRVGSLGRADLATSTSSCCRRATTPALSATRAAAEGLGAAGGTLITIAEATRWATREGVNLLDTNALLKDGRPGCSGDDRRGADRRRERLDVLRERTGRNRDAVDCQAERSYGQAGSSRQPGARQPGQASKPEPLPAPGPGPEPR